METILISGCLLGINCKYSGGNNFSQKLMELIKNKKTIPICPEQLGGLTTPRPPAEIQEGDGEAVLAGRAKVLTTGGRDVTEEFIVGAAETLKIAQLYGANKAILKSGSPSCGCGAIYDGSFSNKKKSGNGVTAALLLKHGIEVVTEEGI